MVKFILSFLAFILVCLSAEAEATTFFSRRGVNPNADVTLNKSLTIAEDLTVTGTTYTGIVLASDQFSGVLTLGGYGSTNNENLTLYFETTSNSIIFDSGTSVSTWVMNDSINMKNDKVISLANGFRGKIGWLTPGGNDSLFIATAVGATNQSGYIVFCENADTADTDRSPSTTSADPVIRVYSSDADDANDFVDIQHNQTNATIEAGNGGVAVGQSGGTLLNIGVDLTTDGTNLWFKGEQITSL